MQWVTKATITEKYVLMSEPDHVWLKPMPNLMKGNHPGEQVDWIECGCEGRLGGSGDRVCV